MAIVYYGQIEEVNLYPNRALFRKLEEPDVGHTVTDRMWAEGTKWLLRSLVEEPGRSPR